MLEKVILKEKVSQIVTEKTANFLKVKSDFQDAQFLLYIFTSIVWVCCVCVY